MSATPKFNIFSDLGGFTVVAIVDRNKFTPAQFESEVRRIEKETGKILASQVKTPEGKARLTFTPTGEGENTKLDESLLDNRDESD